jgi:PTS system mannitol-specific IIC component
MTTSSVAAPDTRDKSRGGARVAVQKFGTFLSGMVMPNIAIFIAWGIITAFFIETGWTSSVASVRPPGWPTPGSSVRS